MTTLLVPGTAKTALPIASLLSQHSHPYLLATRTPGSANTFTDASGQIHPTVALDLTDPSTFAPAFAAASPPVTRLYVAPPPIPDFPRLVSDFIRFAVRNGVTRIVFLSASSIPRGGPAHGQVHSLLHELTTAATTTGNDAGSGSGLEYAVLKPTWFAQNFAFKWSQHVAGIKAESRIYSATGAGKVPWVDVVDIGAVGYYALTEAEGASAQGREYLIVGPEALSYGQVALILGEVLGREVKHVNVSVEELTARFVELGLPKEYAPVLAAMDAEIEKGSEEKLKGCVEKVLGRKPRALKDVLMGEKEAGAFD